MNKARSQQGIVRPHIVIFAGGTASRNLTIALIRQGVRVTRLVPAWDSGGSSKVIRETLHVLPVGDIRQALMTMAYAEGVAGDVVRIFNARLSETGSKAELAREVAFYVQGAHPVLKAMQRGIADAILRYLAIFIGAAGRDFDWRRGSIGNFILAGALLAEDGDINAAILAFKSLCGISANVWPASTNHDLMLTAELNDGRVIRGQHLITGLTEEDAHLGIRSITLAASANPQAEQAVIEADAILYGPGSFLTSVLPHLLVDGIAAAIARSAASKILIGNMLEDRETRKLTLAGMARHLIGAAEGRQVLTHIFAHEGSVPVERVVGGSRFVAKGAPFPAGVDVIGGDFEDPWHRGTHDAGLLSSLILNLASAGVRR